MPPVGRPPTHRGVHPFAGMLLPPDELVLETSFVVDALISSQPRHAECRAFLEAIALAGSRVIFNRFIETELWEVAYQIALKELHPKVSHRKVRLDRRTLKRARTLRNEVETAWEEALTTLDWLVVELDEVVDHVPALMGYGLTSYDAVHAATAVYADVRPFVTLDFHFASVPPSSLELWVSSGRVGPCRKRRGGRAASQGG
jgi:predicted nucleic acid-binding protein